MGIDKLLVLGNYYWNSPYHRNTLYIRAFKAGNVNIGKAYGKALAKSLTNITADAIIPIPGDPVRNRTRGFNPSSVLAEEISQSTGIPIINALSRTSCTRAYVTPKRILEKVYNIKTRISGNVLLVDDLISSGKTKRICASLLRKAGAQKIIVLAVAKAMSLKRPEQLNFTF